MKLKKIISAVSALAMSISMLTVANAASLGGKPVVEAEFEKYELVNGSIPVAYVNVTIDVSAAEKLSAYEIGYDDMLNEVATGNGITTLGVQWTAPTGFSYLKGFSTIPSGFAVESGKASFGPKSVADEYLIDESVTIRLALKPSSNDSASDFTITSSSVDGTNTTDGNVTWSYHTSKGNIDVVSCSIPSYNEWSKPAAPTTPVVSELENGGKMYGMDTKVAKVTVPENVEVSKAVVKLGTESKEYDLPAGVKGALEGFIAIIRYSVDEVGANPAFELEIK